VVQDLLDIILGQRNGRHTRLDVFSQWERAADYRQRCAELIVMARLGALLHDFCHIAYGHSIEDDLGLLTPHDANVARYNRLWAKLGDGDPVRHREVQRLLRGDLRKALRPLILSKERDSAGKKLPPPEERLRELGKYPFVADMVGNTICADLLDYLQRDHTFTGLPAALGRRFMTEFYVVPAAERDETIHYPERMALAIARDRRPRADIVSELLKHLRFRYELQERVIVHHAKLAADAMLGKMLELWLEHLQIEKVRERGGPEVDRALRGGADPPTLRQAFVEDVGETEACRNEADVSQSLELRISDIGDDSLLEYLAGWGTRARRDDVPDPAATLARDLLGRRLYKRAAQAASASARDRQRIYRLFGGRDERRRLEREAARYAGIPDEHVVVWLPEPKMRLKTAEVLVDYGTGIAPFHEYSDLATEIYAAHRELWTITVFVHRDVERSGQDELVLARLAQLMQVAWDRHRPPGAERPDDWPLRRAAVRVVGYADFDQQVEDLLKEAAEKVNRSGQETFADVKAELARLHRARKRRMRAARTRSSR
jgi:HD superfamily phosphohydrolase